MKRSVLSRLFLFVLALTAGTTAFAQNAQITGRVTDQSDAVVPGAEVSATNQQTALMRNAIANSDGYFTILYLPPGTYKIAVKKDGFKSIERLNVILNVDQVARLDFTLEAGAVTDAVTITSDAPLLNSETASVEQVVDNKTVVTLPLNGRNYTQLMALAPGAQPNPRSRAADAVQLNGQRAFQTTYLIDGMDNNNYIIGADSGTTQAVRPSIDAIQEFRVESSNFSAEYGRSSGGVVNVAIKSGTNELHGTAFEFLRNDALDASDFFTNRSGLKKPPYRFNQFGGTLGGPLVKNKLFLFGSYQGTLIRTARTAITTVPTADMKRGIFPSPVYDPFTLNSTTLTRQPFANNTIPQARWDAVGAKLIQLYPNPNLPGLTNNYAGQIRTQTDDHQVDVRGDYVLSSKDTLFARFSRNNRDNNQGSLFGAPGYGGTFFVDQPVLIPSSAWSVVGGHNRVFSPTWANDLRLGYTHNQSNHLSPSTDSLYSQFGFLGVPGSDTIPGLPTILASGYSVLGDRLFEPNERYGNILYLTDNVTWTRGTHSMRFGGETRLVRQFYGGGEPGAGLSRGLYVITGLLTGQRVGLPGSAMADLLLGQTTQVRIAASPNVDIPNYNYGFYFNDTWKTTPNLTLQLGVRYEVQSPGWESNQKAVNFDLNPGSPTYGTLVNAKDGSIRDRSFVNLDKNNFAPRLGLAYRLNDKTVIRAAAGIFYGGLGQFNTTVGNLPLFVTISTPINVVLVPPTQQLQAGLPAGILDPKNAVGASAEFWPEDRPILETYQWNLSVQRELPGNFAITASYVGSGTSHLLGGRNINQPLPGTTAIPFPQFGAVSENSPFAHATYHSLQTKVERRFSNGVSLLSSWTWSHAIDGIPTNEDLTTVLGPQDPNNLSLEKASSAIDIRHRWVTSAIYDLPIGRKDRWLGDNAVARAVLGGWQLGGIFVTQTGLAFTPGVTRTVADGLSLRPNLLRDPNLSDSQRSVDRWFDPTAFAAPAVGAIGTAGRNILRGPGLTNLDLLVSRSFRLTETKRLDFRAEFFNALNKTHLGLPNATIDQPTAGRITSVQAPPRQIQFGLKFVF
jgi:hypothetical protein